MYIHNIKLLVVCVYGIAMFAQNTNKIDNQTKKNENKNWARLVRSGSYCFA